MDFPYRFFASRHGKYYVYPWGESVSEQDPRRRCFTRRGARRKQAKLNRREAELYDPSVSGGFVIHPTKNRWEIGYWTVFPNL